MHRREFLKAAGMAGVAAPWTMRNARAQRRERPPNIVFIIVDDLGYADLGCYGSTAIETPCIDRMAKEGMRFTQAYSGCTVCAPARCTLMTGYHMGHAAVRGNTGGIPLPEDAVTIAQLLKNAGYATGGFGKWGLGDIDTEGVPEKHGFDDFFGYYHQIHAHDYYPEYLVRNGSKVAMPGNRKTPGETYSQYPIFEATCDFIRNNKDRSFFCYAPWTPPHGQYFIPEDDPAWHKYKDKPWERKARVVAAMTGMIDRQVGQVLDLLEERGIADNTVVFFCSDNGASYRFEGELDSSGPLRGRKRDMYEGGIRVPMVARWPGRIAAGTESALPWYFPDVLPTCCALAGIQAPADIDGMSVAPALLGSGAQMQPRHLYWEWPTYDWGKQKYTGLIQAVRHGDWKLLRQGEDLPWELYDLANDPGEQNNIAAEHPERVTELRQWVDANRRPMPPQVEPEMPEGKKFR